MFRQNVADSSSAIVALLTVCTIFTSARFTSAQDTGGRATLSNPANPLPPDFLSGPVKNVVLRPMPGPRPAVTTAEAAGFRTRRADSRVEGWRQVAREGVRAAAPPRTSAASATGSESHEQSLTMPLSNPRNVNSAQGRTSVTASASTQVYPRAVTGANVRTAAPAQVYQGADASTNTPVQAETWQQEYSYHVDDVLTGGECRSERGTVGDWWQQRLPYVEFVTVEPGQIKASAREFINDHTLPPEHEYDVDIYDQNPISVASSQTMSLARPAAANTDNSMDADEPGKNRLRTDIRKIRPTLSYAMRNIDPGQLPDGFSEKLDQDSYIARQSSPAVLQWAPTNLYHYPLYFEDPSLERYGHTYHPVVQPFASAGRFATQLVGMPYQMALHPVHSREYTLGYYRPGECAPKKHYQIPFNEEAAFMQAAALAGFFLIFP